MTPTQYLRDAIKLVDGDRHKQHGDYRENMDNICQLWAAYLDIRQDGALKPYEVAIQNALQKIARTCLGAFNPDDLRDALGYLAIAAALFEAEQPGSPVIKTVHMPELASVEAKTRA